MFSRNLGFQTPKTCVSNYSDCNKIWFFLCNSSALTLKSKRYKIKYLALYACTHTHIYMCVCVCVCVHTLRHTYTHIWGGGSRMQWLSS